MEESKLEEYETIIASLPDLVFILTESGRYAAVLGGKSAEQYHDGSSLEDSKLMDVLPLSKAAWFIDRIKQTLSANKLMIFEYSLAASDVESIRSSSGPIGELRFEGRVTPLKSLRYGERAVVWVARNITKRYQLEQKLVYQAEVDPVSNAFNRRKLFKCIDEAFEDFQTDKENISFLLLDIDDFKQINDEFGHQAGDRVIRRLAKLCNLEIGANDIFGRIGGDEFGIIYRRTIEASLALGERLNQLLVSTSSDIGISLSIGVSQFEDSDTSIEQIYHRADLALYQSKKAGKNICSSY
ncbi:GGDEF domain-containing protein [Vibrio sp. MA40-2]|uniref:GGDEF domain-containing protein n=1 Tax=Vibrio sp. MA40-2 TaxID=3391828 RepID=UPI0039A4F0EF